MASRGDGAGSVLLPNDGSGAGRAVLPVRIAARGSQLGVPSKQPGLLRASDRGRIAQRRGARRIFEAAVVTRAAVDSGARGAARGPAGDLLRELA